MSTEKAPKSAAKKPAAKKAAVKKTTAKTKSITTYKGFDSNLRCRGFQYEIGNSYTHEGVVKACKSGFHACEHPLDVFRYYPPAGSRFAVVEQSGALSREDGHTKVASRNIAIKAELGIAGLVKAAVEYVSSKCLPVDRNSPASATGYRGAASATGYQGAASATGNRGAASATGRQGSAMSSGYYGRVMGADGCALFLVRRDDNGNITHAKAAIAGRDGIKPMVWYELNEKGEFKEVSE